MAAQQREDFKGGSVFLSYASPDRERVTPYFNDLAARGHDVWIDWSRLKPGQNWDFEIQRALNRAAIVVVFVSKNSLDRRGYVQREIKVALDKAKEKLATDIYLIPVLLDNDAILPDELRHIQAVRSGDTGCLDRIDDAIRHQLKQVGDAASQMQGAAAVNWHSSTYREAWEGLPGYETEFGLFHFTSTKHPKVSEVTEIIRGSLLSHVADQRVIKLQQSHERFNFGQEAYSRMNTWEAFPSEPNIVGQILSLHYNFHWYGAGAAHPNMNFQTFCFLLDPIVRIDNLAEVFEEASHALATIQFLAREQLSASLSADGAMQDDWLMRGTKEWLDFRNFAFNSDGLQLYFDPYQVASYASGPQIVDIPFDAVKRLMKPWFRNALGIHYFETSTETTANARPSAPIAVESVADLLKNASSRRMVIVKDASFIISDAFPSSSSNIRWHEVNDGKELSIYGVTDFDLRGDRASILAAPQHAWVLTFDYCHNITLRDLTFGHIEEGYCQGGVLRFRNCQGIKVKSCDLYGSGTYGLAFEDCTEVEIDETIVRDCSYGILNITDCKAIRFTACSFRNNRQFDLCNFAGETAEIMFKNCVFENNVSAGAMFNLKGITGAASNVRVWNSKFSENDCPVFQDESGFFSERKNEYFGNSWQRVAD